MVRFFFLLAAILLSACSPAKWWGEEAPPPKVASAPKSLDQCPGPGMIFRGDEGESRLALDCLESDVEEAWRKVRGQEQQVLSEREIDVLVERGIVDLASGNPDLSKKKIRGIRRLLTINGKLKKSDTDALLIWLRTHRNELNKVIRAVRGEEIRYETVRSILLLASSYLKERPWKLEQEELGAILRDILADRDSESALPEIFAVGHDVVSVLCPGHAQTKSWDGKILSSCFDSLARDFDAGAEWIDFILDQVRPGIDLEQVKLSLDRFSAVVEARLAHPEATGLHPELWVRLAKKMKAYPPEGFLDSLDLLKKLHPQSSGRYIHPGAVNLTLRIVRNYHAVVFQAIPVFQEIHAQGKCLNQDAANWRACIVAKPAAYAAKNESFRLALKLKNTAYGAEAVPFDGHLLKKLALFHSIGGEVLRAFDADGDGVISSGWDQESDEVIALLGASLSSIDIISRFINNMKSRANGERLYEQEEFSSFEHLNLKGLAHLVTIAGSDVLVKRDKKERILLEKILDNITNSFPTNSLQLDHDALSAILAFVSSFGSYREAFVGSVESPAFGIPVRPHPRFGKLQIDRPSTIAALPRVLERHFPRTHQSCLAMGFERSCGIALDEILPLADPGGDWTSASDLDLLTLVVGSLESLLDSCDYDSSGTLSWKLLDGEDELDCAFTKFSNITKRLMDSKIARVKNEKRVHFALSSISSLFLTRSFAKVALIRGTTKGIAAAPITIWFEKEATLGSIYALLSEILAKDRVEALSRSRP